MPSVLSLINGPGATELSVALLDRVNSVCQEEGSACGRWTWLDTGRAIECDLERAGASLLARLRALLAPQPIDVNLVPGTLRRKRLLVSDMDATAIIGETLDDLSAFTPFKAEIDALTRQSVEGAMGFAESLVKRVEMLRGLDLDAFARTHAKMRPSPGIRTLVATMRAQGALTALVSGGFGYFTSRLGRELGFDLDIANELEIEGGKLTGRLVPPIVDAEAKARMIHELADRHGLDRSQALAVGDGANDIAMLGEAGLGIAYRGKAKLREAIAHQIDHADLTGLLFLQGYHRDEFVERER